ncbi:uncharacterized protein LOC129600001 [Paramacrobiotus metropolitanus]|uniref:uncharacterized protein LOC129600001 n=1 Tax=Paramacrobiotus metropolitanus TaxID=2943436 RepID=UPI0024465620|nr:uncharacterized protein LOC129600001 [Paramacrobiotus metropolitanus]
MCISKSGDAAVQPSPSISELAKQSLYFAYITQDHGHAHHAPFSLPFLRAKAKDEARLLPKGHHAEIEPDDVLLVKRKEPLPAPDTFITVDLQNPAKTLEVVQPEVAAPEVPVKAGNRRFRWNLLWFAVFCVGFVPLPLWLSAVSCVGGYLASCIVTVWMSVVMLVCVGNASWTMVRMFRAKNKSWLEHYPSPEAGQQLVHLVIMAGYKEPLPLMCNTLDTFRQQTVRERLCVVVGLEEKTPEFAAKKAELLKRYSGDFLDLLVTQHPFGVPGEIPGKCSNSNYAARQAVAAMQRSGTMSGAVDAGLVTVTLCDTDNLFPPRYFEYLGYDFLRRQPDADRHEVVWQAPLLYNYDLDKRPFFVRVTGILRGLFMMGMLIPQDINTMSCFSMSLNLLIAGDYIHPGYQMDDIICTLHRMIALHKRIRIPLIPYPVVSGPTSGVDLRQEVTEWARQARRWTIGAAEVFHYFCVKWRSFDGWSGVRYGVTFTHYYGFVICGMSLFSFTSLVASAGYHGAGVCDASVYLAPLSPYLMYAPLGGVAFSYVIYLWAFILDAVATRGLLNLREDIGFLRNVLHWAVAPLVLLAYSAVEYYAICEVALRGKEVCKHGASKKDGLATPPSSAGSPASSTSVSTISLDMIHPQLAKPGKY